MPSTIYLVGFMASGKSTVGPVLAEKFDCPFIDLDRMIEIEFDCTIADLIAREGEEGFRRIETETLRRAAHGACAVIAPGGGAVTIADNLNLMSRSGITVWLDAPFELCWQRIQQDRAVRPMAPNEQSARQRYQDRLQLYRLAAIRIPIEEAQTPDETAAAIVIKIKGLKGLGLKELKPAE